MYKPTDEIFVRINRNGYIPIIGICGPIPNPIKVKTEVCLKLVNAGIDVHQFDPETKQTVKITRENVFDDAKFAKKKAASVQTQVPIVNPSAPINLAGVVKKEEPKVEEAAPAPVVEEVAPVVEEPVVETTEVVAEEEATTETEEVKVEESEEAPANTNNYNKYNKNNKRR
jgi:hypothetical protein